MRCMELTFRRNRRSEVCLNRLQTTRIHTHTAYRLNWHIVKSMGQVFIFILLFSFHCQAVASHFLLFISWGSQLDHIYILPNKTKVIIASTSDYIWEINKKRKTVQANNHIFLKKFDWLHSKIVFDIFGFWVQRHTTCKRRWIRDFDESWLHISFL